jgi:hypothetical protein
MKQEFGLEQAFMGVEFDSESKNVQEEGFI